MAAIDAKINVCRKEGGRRALEQGKSGGEMEESRTWRQDSASLTSCRSTEPLI